MGSATVEYLQGKVGDVDVKDCITAMQEAVRKYPWLDPERVGLCGGSHGGFLVAHLSGQAPVVKCHIIFKRLKHSYQFCSMLKLLNLNKDVNNNVDLYFRIYSKQ